MRKLIALIALCALALPLRAQHSISIDDGAGNTTVLDAGTTGGIKHYTFAGLGGKILTLTGVNSKTLTIGGNAFTWPDPATGYLHNDGSGNLSWDAGTGSGGTEMCLTGHSNSVGVGQDNFALPNGFRGAVAVGSLNNSTVTMPFAGTVKAIYATFQNDPDNGTGAQYYEISVYNVTQNTNSGVATINQGFTKGNATGLSLTFAAGDELTIRFHPDKVGGVGNNPSAPGEVSYGVLISKP